MQRLKRQFIVNKTKNKFDLTLDRLSKSSQILLVAGAIFGYFYTIRPIHQNQVLSEEIALKETNIKRLNNELLLKSDSLSSIKKNISKYLIINDSLKSKSLNLEQNIKSLSKKIKESDEMLFYQLAFRFQSELSLLVMTSFYIDINHTEIAQNWVKDNNFEFKKVITRMLEKIETREININHPTIPQPFNRYFIRLSKSILSKNFEPFNKSDNKSLDTFLRLSQRFDIDCDTVYLYDLINETEGKIIQAANELDRKQYLAEQLNNIRRLLECISIRYGNEEMINNSIKILLSRGLEKFLSIFLQELNYEKFQDLI